MLIHTIFELLALISGFAISLLIKRPKSMINDDDIRYKYNIVLLLGVTIGAFGIGSANIILSTDSHGIGKSVFGALFGGIVVAEIFKKIYNIKGSTGAYFVPSLAIGIAIGRIGCFLAGIEDYTYGVVTTMPWSHDFGDGLIRHPVQLYESASMWIFFSYSIYLYRHHQEYFEKYIFYQFVGFYGLQRFLWEFLKPYDSIIYGLNIFQIGCLALIAYAVIFTYKQKAIK